MSDDFKCLPVQSQLGTVLQNTMNISLGFSFINVTSFSIKERERERERCHDTLLIQWKDTLEGYIGTVETVHNSEVIVSGISL